MEKHEEQIRRLARRYGVAEQYYNIRGELITVPLESLSFIVECLQDEEPEFPPVVVSKGRQLFLSGPPEKGEVVIQNEDQEEVNRYSFVGPTIPLCLPREVPWGYYRVHLTLPHAFHTLMWVFSPFRAFFPPHRMWGLQAALYSLATERNQGIGDLKDLEDLARVLHEKGGSFLGLLPLYLLDKRESASCSPYFPLDRLSFEPLYLPLEEIASRFGVPYEESAFQEVRYAREIDYQMVWQKKDQFLRTAFTKFWQEKSVASPRWETFQEFLAKRGERLLLASFFQAFAEKEGSNWQKWPEALRHLRKESIKGEIAANEPQVLYYAFLQWLLEEQLTDLKSRHPLLGFDLPIGSAPHGLENWLIQHKVVFACSVGAPPDDFAPQGQDWGIAPLHPFKERREGYRHFIDLLRFQFRFARFLRLDHIMGLQRLFWIPRGAHPKDGTYVRNFLAELLAILTLESHRHGVTIIGEDLGTVPNSVRRAMEKTGLLSTKVFYFERDFSNRPRHPSLYHPLSFTTINTHDMPTILGFLTSRDIEIRERLGIFTPQEAERQKQERQEFIQNCFQMGSEWGWKEEMPLWERFFWFLTRTPSLLIALSLDDLLESEQQPNLPGTVTEFPNWRHRLVVPKDLPQRIERLARMFFSER